MVTRYEGKRSETEEVFPTQLSFLKATAQLATKNNNKSSESHAKKKLLCKAIKAKPSPYCKIKRQLSNSPPERSPRASF